MPFTFPPRRKNPPVRRDATEGIKDLNTLAHPSMAKNEEATELLNAIYSQYGTTSKRSGSVILGGDGDGDKCKRLFAAYDVGGNDYLIRLTEGKPEYYNFSNSTWQNLSGTPPSGYTGTTPEFISNTPVFSNPEVQIAQSYGIIWFSSEDDEMTWFDGTAWFVRSPLPNPTVKPTVAKTGSGTGSATYYYRYVNYNESGGTLASPVFASGDADGTGYKNSMPATLDETTYLTVTIPAAPAGTTRRAIFRGDTAGNEFFLKEISASETTFVDKGENFPSITAAIPIANTTSGYHYKLMDVFERRLVGVTKEAGHSIITWSDPYPLKTSFSHTPDLSGYDDYYNGDGEDISAIKTFTANNTGGLYVFKDSRIGVFEIGAEGNGEIRDVSAFVGSVSPKSVHIAGNNLRFWSPEGPAMLGNEKNFGTILRYSVMGVKVEGISKTITLSARRDVASEFLDHKSFFSFSNNQEGYNNQMLVYDERYDAWSLWTGLFAHTMVKFKDKTSGRVRLFYGSSKDPRVVEMLTGKTDYGTTATNGTKVVYSLTTKQYTMGLPDRFKKFQRIVLVFAYLSGDNTTVKLSYANEDGVVIEDPIPITSSKIRSGFGTQLWGDVLIGTGNEVVSDNSLFVRYIDLAQQDLFWVQATISNDGIDDSLSLLGIIIYYSDSDRQLPFESQLVRD